jgi:hypothetical protein
MQICKFTNVQINISTVPDIYNYVDTHVPYQIFTNIQLRRSTVPDIYKYTAP